MLTGEATRRLLFDEAQHETATRFGLGWKDEYSSSDQHAAINPLGDRTSSQLMKSTQDLNRLDIPSSWILRLVYRRQHLEHDDEHRLERSNHDAARLGNTQIPPFAWCFSRLALGEKAPSRSLALALAEDGTLWLTSAQRRVSRVLGSCLQASSGCDDLDTCTDSFCGGYRTFSFESADLCALPSTC